MLRLGSVIDELNEAKAKRVLELMLCRGWKQCVQWGQSLRLLFTVASFLVRIGWEINHGGRSSGIQSIHWKETNSPIQLGQFLINFDIISLMANSGVRGYAPCVLTVQY